MSCYTRHLREEMAAVGLADDRSGRQEADRRTRWRLGLGDANCPDVWRKVKEMSAEERLGLLRPESEKL
jgi:hypothetical protein